MGESVRAGGTPEGDTTRARPLVLVALSLVMFTVLVGVYWISVPHEFNTVRENRRFFDSDGEFITRQFREGETFTHETHLLYHVIGSELYQVFLPFERGWPVVIHQRGQRRVLDLLRRLRSDPLAHPVQPPLITDGVQGGHRGYTAPLLGVFR